MYVIGTAGHVDHGKSTLVKALTGIDPDRLAEERQREMTIDLGFAWCALPKGTSISLVDVPGHERFIKNMLAGVGGIDAALFVVAADEGMMPQTEEHLAILDLLGINHAVVALTKIDLVEPDWLAMVTDDVTKRFKITTLAHSVLVPVSARSGTGLPDLLAALETMLSDIPSRTVANGKARLPIDRAFTIGGFGTVVTGTLLDGPIAVGDEVEIVPKGIYGRVRGLQSHQQKQEKVQPGTRVAVNLASVSHHDINRGDLLALPGVVAATEVIDVQMRAVADLAQTIEQNTALELFVGAAHVLCRATLLDRASLAAGETGWLQLRLVQPLAVARGDRYILRQPALNRTIGGGIVVDAHPPRHRRFRAEVVTRLESLLRGAPADLLRPAFADGRPHTLAEAQSTTKLDSITASEAAQALIGAGELIALGTQHAPHDVLISAASWPTLRDTLAAALAGYHRRYPLRQGIPREDLRSRLKLASSVFDAVLAATEQVHVNQRLVWLVGHQPTLNPTQQRAAQHLLDAIAQQPYSPPPPEIDDEVLGLLIEQGHLNRVSSEIVFLAEHYQHMIDWVLESTANGASVTVGAFRDRFRTSRKYALALLEHLDERRLTRRQGEGRIRY